MTVIERNPREARKAAIASLVGSALEWYDFFLYGTAAALVFNTLFFPTFDPLVGTIAAFGTSAAGYLARPLGGVVFGHFGDLLGRKSALVITLVMMGIATFLIGVLPTYAQIGVWAPVLLIVLRMVQGIAVGGEWGGGVLIVSEQAPDKRRGFFSAWSQTGVGLGFVLSASIFALVQFLTDEAAFLEWGWRVPFLAGIAITAVGLVIRLRVMETPAFREQAPTPVHERLPIVEVLRTQRKPVLITFGARIAENGALYIFLTFSLAYAVKIDLDRQVVLTAVIVGMLLESFAMPMFGALSDRIGRRPVYFAGAIATILWAYPFFELLNTRDPLAVVVAITVAVVFCHGPMIGTQPAFFTELFDSRVRYSGVALGHELASTFAGGFSPMIAAALLAWAGVAWPIVLFLVAMGVITVLAVAAAPETNGTNIDPVDTAHNDNATTADRA